MWYWLFKYVFMGPLLSLLGRPKVQGLEYIPDSGAVILASNHLAVADSFYLPLVVKRRITFLAKSEYFTGTGMKGWFSRWFYTVAGQVPIDRTDAVIIALSSAWYSGACSALLSPWYQMAPLKLYGPIGANVSRDFIW